MRRYALIGAGMMGAEHIRNLAMVDDADLAAIVDPNTASRERASEVAEVKFSAVDCYSDVRDVVDRPDIDAFIVATPNHTHFDIAMRLMESGKPILLEKPMCTTEPNAQALYEHSLAYPGLLWIGLEYRYMPPVTKFIDYAHQHMTGPIKMLSIKEHRFPFLPKVGDWNRFNRNTGGTLVEKCCHFFDLMRHILQDEPLRVFASGGQDVNHLDERYDGAQPDILDNAYVIVDFCGGARAVLDLCMFAEGSPEQEEIYVAGPKGKLEVEIPSGNVSWRPRDRANAFVEHVSVPEDVLTAGDHHGATYYQLKRFHDCITSGAPPEVSALDGLRSVQMGLAAHRSIDIDAPVLLPSLSPKTSAPAKEERHAF